MRMLPATLLALVLATSSGVANAAPPTDLAIEVIDLQPPPGAVLKVNEPVTVTFRYRYRTPNQPLLVWAKVLDPTYASTYQGSQTQMRPGTGIEERSFYLKEPGSIDRFTIVAKDPDLREVHATDVAARYTYVADAELERLAKDGAGSRITGVRFSPGSPAVLQAGSTVDVEVAFDIRGQRGLHVSAEPVTACNSTYAGTFGPERGKGQIRKGFTVGERCEVRQIRVTLINVANRVVAERLVDVDFRFAGPASR